MTLTKPKSRVTYFYKCQLNAEHTFQHSDRTVLWCPVCRGPAFIYGLKDSTRYGSDIDDDIQPESPAFPS
jgi:hypothetical protein